MSGLDIRYDFGDGHPLLGRRMPDLDLITADGPQRVFTLLHDARPLLLNVGEPGSLDFARWEDRVRPIDAQYIGPWELPVLGNVMAPGAVVVAGAADIDAFYTARMPSTFRTGGGKVKRLFENYQEIEQAYYRKTRIFPIMHTVAIKRSVYEQHPWVAMSLYKAFALQTRECVPRGH